MDERHGDDIVDDGEDVAQLLNLLKRVRSDNVDLRRNFESVTVEKQYQALCESWRLELEEKQRQFDHAKTQIMGPRDVEMIKVTMMEKMEAPFRAKCDRLAKEAEAAQQAYIDQRRAFEELQAANRSLELRAQRDREILEADHAATVTQLKDQLAALAQTQVRFTQTEAKNKALEREKADLVHQLSMLREEVDSLQHAKERASVEKDSIELRVERKVKSIQAEELQLSGLVETLTRKNRHLQKELAEAHRSNEEMFDQRLKLQGAQAVLQSQLDLMRKQHDSEQAAQEEQHMQGVRALEDKLLLLRDQLHDKERQMAELHINHQEQMTQVVESHSTRIEELEKEHARKMREAKEHSAELSAKAEALRDALDECRREADDLQSKSKRDQEGQQRQLERLQAQLADSQRLCVGREVELSQVKGEADQLKADVMRLELSNAQLEKGKEELGATLGRLNEQVQQLGKERQELAKVCEGLKQRLEQDRQAHLERADQQRQSFAVEKSAITKRHQAAMQELATKHKADLKKLKQRLRGADASTAELANKLTEMSLRTHELEGMASQLQDTTSTRHGLMPVQLSTQGAFLPSAWGKLADVHGRAVDQQDLAKTAVHRHLGSGRLWQQCCKQAAGVLEHIHRDCCSREETA